MTTPTCHLTLPLASASFRYFSCALRSPPAPFRLFSINFRFLSTSFHFCSDLFPTLPPPTALLPLWNMFPMVQYTSNFIIEPSAHFCSISYHSCCKEKSQLVG